MTDKKITELPEVTALTDDDVLVVVDGASVTKKILVGNAKTSIVADHLADTTDAHDASAVSVADAGGYYTGTDVETVLAEVGRGVAFDERLPEPVYGPSIIAPPAALFAASAAGAWYAADYVTVMKFTVERTRTYRYINLYVGTQSGNIQVGVSRMRISDEAFIRVAHSDVVACPAAGDHRIDLGYFTLTPGTYGLFLWCDNTTAQFLHGLSAGITATKLTYTASIGGGVPAAAIVCGATTRWVTGLTLEADKLSVSLLGDSITANDNNDPTGAGSWFSHADSATGYRFYAPTNNGAAGEWTHQILARAAAAFSGKRYAVVLGGTNDIGNASPAATIIANLQDIYDAAVAAGLVGFAACTIPPRTGLTAQTITDLKAVNAWIRANYSSYTGAVLVDWSWALSDGTDETTPLTANFLDGVHPAAPGSAIMSAVLQRAIRDWV